jgi:hypothetical protein
VNALLRWVFKLLERFGVIDPEPPSTFEEEK